MVFRPLVALALTSALAGCGGGASAPDGGDAHLDAPTGDTTDGGGGGAAIVVDTPSGFMATESQDGHCDILEAVAAAARGRTVDECEIGRASCRERVCQYV